MPTDPNTGTESKLIMSAMFLFWKLTEIQKHLRDFTQEIVYFSNFLADRLDFVSNPAMTPQDFVREWKGAIDARRFELTAEFGGIDECRDPKEMRENIRAQVALDHISKLMLMFAEDLCGKEFAEEVHRVRGESGDSSFFAPKIGNPAEEAKPADWAGFVKDGERQPETENRSGCHPFPPEPPVVEQEAERKPHRFAHLLPGNELSDIEHFPPPPGHESVGHEGWDG